MNRGIIYACIAYGLWGILPVYWKLLESIPAYELLCHRIFWTFVTVMALMVVRRQFNWLAGVFRNRKTMIMFLGSSILIGFNWFTYIWAVQSGYVVEASLGYFINPLVNVLLGVIFLKERLRRGQLTAILMAAAGVLYLTFSYGSFPYIALVLAGSFGMYGLLRKTAPLNALEGLGLELMTLILPVVGFLTYLNTSHIAAVHYGVDRISIMLVFTGVITTIPLIMFAAAARRITLTTLGLTQYIAPTLQFLIGVFMFHEPFTRVRFVGFSIVWIALIIYTTENIFAHYKIVKLQRGVCNAN
ncbi:EamA family transporter RarD [candidate division KSB1 bacterium]|nr:EamA family transporter RarD [candidate division KSB1 bacterium]